MFSYYLFKDIVYDYLSQFEHRSVLTKFCVDDIMSHFVLNFKSCHLPWSWSCHMVQFLRKSRSTLIFLLAGDSFKKSFDSFAQFFTKQYIIFPIIFKINSFNLAGFFHAFLFPKHTLSFFLLMHESQTS
jgi:hypothetical protein